MQTSWSADSNTSVIVVMPGSVDPSSMVITLLWQCRHKVVSALSSRRAKPLPKPVWVIACYDIRGRQLLDVCLQLSLIVPDKIGVIGQHADHFFVELCYAPLPWVIPDPRSEVYNVAASLD